MIWKSVLATTALALGMTLAGAGGAMAKTIELKLASFMAPTQVQHTKVLEPWAKKINEQTNGQVKITVFAASALGKPQEHYDMAAKGIADISFPILSYSPGRFKLSTVLELPFMMTTSEAISAALWQIYEKFCQDEFKDVKVLWLFQHGSSQLFTVKKPVKTLADLNGMKVRCTNPLVNKSITMMGASPVFMPVPEVYAALERGVLDGTTISYEGLVAFKQDEVVKYATTLDMYALNMAIVMNKKKWESLPEDVKKVFDENSGLSMSRLAGKVFDEAEAENMAKAKAKGVEVVQMEPAELAKWKQQSRTIWLEWAKEMDAQGLAGTAVLNEAIALMGHEPLTAK
ncbi:MAG: TRAP transporter substrate-binding protein [Desulfarculus sp.]|nr:TRAP transporter substrate-binding protein [Desulfarculus sp.]